MITADYLRELYDYNYWARDRQLDACAALAPEKLAQPLGASFGSLRDTLTHLLGAEWAWLERFNGRSPRSFPLNEELRSVEGIRSRWQEVEQGMRAHLAALTPEMLAAPLTYQNFKGETWTYPRWQTLVHLANHGTYHRGQVTIGLRQLGATPPALDYLVYRDRLRRASA